MNSLETKVIKCPHCGCEYLPSEIYYPNDFLGKPSDIMKDPTGKIEYWNGDSMNLVEEYTCDNCGTTFTVEAEVSFKSTVNDMHNFNEDYTSTIFKNRITLDEQPQAAALFDSEG